MTIFRVPPAVTSRGCLMWLLCNQLYCWHDPTGWIVSIWTPNKIYAVLVRKCMEVNCFHSMHQCKCLQQQFPACGTQNHWMLSPKQRSNYTYEGSETVYRSWRARLQQNWPLHQVFLMLIWHNLHTEDQHLILYWYLDIRVLHLQDIVFLQHTTYALYNNCKFVTIVTYKGIITHLLFSVVSKCNFSPHIHVNEQFYASAGTHIY